MPRNVALSRREFLKLTGLVASAIFLESCTLPSPEESEATTASTATSATVRR